MSIASSVYDCCGCTACEAVCSCKAITMQCDEQGFLYPMVDEQICTNCGKCTSACPIQRYDRITDKKYTPDIYALYNLNESVRLQSSSGGVFSAMSEYILGKNGVVFGAAYDNDFVVVHKAAETIAEAERFRGSKYTQSDLRGVFVQVKTILQSGRPVLFSGTPCQVEGLKGYLRKSYSNLYTVDLLCHGVPSPLVFSDYVRFVNHHSLNPLSDINMKDKTFGWGHQNTRLFFADGSSEFNTVLSNLWCKVFFGHLATRPSCHRCRFTNFMRPGDITIGDFWGIAKTHPDFYSPKGVSLMTVNSAQGHDLWAGIRHQFKYICSNADEAIQPSFTSCAKEPINKKQFWTDYKNNSFDYIARKYYDVKRICLWYNKVRQSFAHFAAV